MPYQMTLLVVCRHIVAVRHLSCLLCVTITRTDRRKTKMNENIEILQRQFDVYCTKVLKYASISYYHANRRRMKCPFLPYWKRI